MSSSQSLFSRALTLGAVGCMALVLLGGCGTATAPQVAKKLRDVPLASSADLEAYNRVESSRKQLDAWCKEASQLRLKGEPIPDDHAVIDGQAEAEVERIRGAVEVAASPELVEIISTLADAHVARLEVLLRPKKKFPEKAYIRADRLTTELGFGLRRWYSQR